MIYTNYFVLGIKLMFENTKMKKINPFILRRSWRVCPCSIFVHLCRWQNFLQKSPMNKLSIKRNHLHCFLWIVQHLRLIMGDWFTFVSCKWPVTNLDSGSRYLIHNICGCKIIKFLWVLLSFLVKSMNND